MISLPRLYAIADAEFLARRNVDLREFGAGLLHAGVSLVQLRDKRSPPQQVLEHAAVLREVLAGSGCRLILNDRADLAVLAGFGGVHVGQDDRSPADARRVVGTEAWVGLSTHTEDQLRAAENADADYVAVGPVFATNTKPDAESAVGLEGVRRARALTGKPLVAIGGITRENARSVIDAGADSVAVISGLLPPGETPEQAARDFLQLLR